ncbi:MAG: hypothetical protein IJQ66_04735 [Clostridia bacterium]|nr:hypothetical protein [Clostridia bacterium]
MASLTKGRFKDKFRSGYSRAKAKVQNVANNVKQKAIKYRDTMSESFSVGYSSGKRDYSRLPKVAGSYKSASVGYHQSLKDMQKSEKLRKRLGD